MWHNILVGGLIALSLLCVLVLVKLPHTDKRSDRKVVTATGNTGQIQAQQPSTQTMRVARPSVPLSKRTDTTMMSAITPEQRGW